MNWKNYLDALTKVIFVVGHTASGKSAWALAQAQKFGGIIVNSDSVQFYKGLETGSAAPSEEELKLVPHYLYSYVERPDEMTAGRFIRDFYQLVDSKKIAGPIFVVGGTGFYLQALEKGMFDVEPVPDEFRKIIENELQEFGAEKLFAELKKADPDSQIHVNDHYRLVRAVEILRYNQKMPSELKTESQNLKNKNALPFPYIKIGFSLEKEQCLLRVEKRTKWMIENGIIAETKVAIEQGFEDWAPLFSVGLKETAEYLIHNKSTEWLFESINKSTMQLIKKQKTWFKRDATLLWSDQTEGTLSTINSAVKKFLAN